MLGLIIVLFLLIIIALLGGGRILSAILSFACFLILLLWLVLSGGLPTFLNFLAIGFLVVMTLFVGSIYWFGREERRKRKEERKFAILENRADRLRRHDANKQQEALTKSKLVGDNIYEHPSGVFILVDKKMRFRFFSSFEVARKLRQIEVEVEEENRALGL